MLAQRNCTTRLWKALRKRAFKTLSIPYKASQPSSRWVPFIFLIVAIMKLYTYPNNKNAWKALIAAEYVGAKIEVSTVQMGKDNKSPEFLKLNPNGKVSLCFDIWDLVMRVVPRSRRFRQITRAANVFYAQQCSHVR